MAAATIFYLNKSEIVSAFNRWELAAPFNGVTNLAVLIANSTGVSLRVDSTGGKAAGCNSVLSDDNGKINRITMPLPLWYAIVNDIATVINNNIVGGVVGNSDAAWLLGLFFNMGFVNMTNWIDVAIFFPMTDAYNYWNAANVGSAVGFRFTPKNTQNIFASVNGVIGLNKIGTFVDGSNTITANFGANLVGKDVTFRVYDVNDATGAFNVGTNFVGTIASNGLFTSTASVTITPSVPYFSRLASLTLFNKSDFAGNIFYSNVGVGANFNGVQADRMDDNKDGNSF